VVAVLGLLYGSIYGLARKHLARIGRERQAADAQRYQACNEVLGGIKDVQVNQVAPLTSPNSKPPRAFSRATWRPTRR